CGGAVADRQGGIVMSAPIAPYAECPPTRRSPPEPPGGAWTSAPPRCSSSCATA
ncbi:MAG: hypothetical protein AVDCRST_MAG52-1565, partial [uncultured Blastococcus sp.]